MPRKVLHAALLLPKYILRTWALWFRGLILALFKEYAHASVKFARTYGGTGWEDASSVQQTSDGGYIVAGGTTSFGVGGGDILLIKTDANGDIGSCGIVRNASPTVTTPSLSVRSFTNAGSAFPAVTSPILTVSAPCPLSDDNELGISESCQIASGLITPYKGGIKISKSGEFDLSFQGVFISLRLSRVGR